MNKKIYFLSDLHFCHDKDFVYKSRGFNSIEEMNEEILRRWNNIVNEEDEVYVLGDIALSDVDTAIEYIKQLKGKIHLIRGNHCTDSKVEKFKELKNVVDIKFADMIKYRKWNFYLSHYPAIMGVVEDQSKIWCLAGHTHSTDKFENGKNKVYNVACDAHNCTPIEIENVLNDIRQYKIDINNRKI